MNKIFAFALMLFVAKTFATVNHFENFEGRYEVAVSQENDGDVFCSLEEGMLVHLSISSETGALDLFDGHGEKLYKARAAFDYTMKKKIVRDFRDEVFKYKFATENKVSDDGTVRSVAQKTMIELNAISSKVTSKKVLETQDLQLDANMNELLYTYMDYRNSESVEFCILKRIK